MIERQVLSRILESKDYSIVTQNMLDVSYFPSFQEEFKFIDSHVNEYNVVPDQLTFLAKFPNFELVEVTEPNEFLVNSLREEDLYRRCVPTLYRIRDLLQTDANAAAEFMLTATKELQPNYNLKGTDIIAQSETRYNEHLNRAQHQDSWFFETGFKELDDIITGLQRGEELCVLFARLGNGKSWVLEKMCSHIWGLGFNVGYLSPEMSAMSVGFRFDSLRNNFSNRGLMTGKQGGDEYKTYIDELKTHKNKFIVSTPNDLGGHVTVSKIRNWVKQYKLDLVAIDGVKYLADERAHRGDNETTALTNISEDLMELSIELKIPILVVCQANREGVQDTQSDSMPQIENIRSSDGIAQNASKVVALRQKDNMLFMQVQKNRFHKCGNKLRYLWDIDTGNFTYVMADDTPRKRQDGDSSRPKDRGNVF